MQKEITFKRFTLFNALCVMHDAFHVIDTERDRLSKWFWWMDKNVTPNIVRFCLFMLLYLTDIKHKEIVHNFDFKQLYDEQFMIMVDGKFGGMIGLDNINDVTKDAEIWYFVSKTNEGVGVGSMSVKFLEDYSLEYKQLTRLYAKINTENTRSAQCVKRNNFTLKTTEYGIPTSRRNPKIADIMTWEKRLAR